MGLNQPHPSRKAQKKPPQPVQRPGRRHPTRKEVRIVYTDYGYTLNGIEYATIEEAYAAQDEEEDE